MAQSRCLVAKHRRSQSTSMYLPMAVTHVLLRQCPSTWMLESSVDIVSDLIQLCLLWRMVVHTLVKHLQEHYVMHWLLLVYCKGGAPSFCAVRLQIRLNNDILV